jgi:hypothetical protein
MTAMPDEPDYPATAPPTFHLRDWVPLQDAVLQIISLVGGKRDLGLAMINQYLRSGQLELARVAPDLTMTLFSRTDCEHRTVHAPSNPAEGVRVEPYEAGYYVVRRDGLPRLTSPATPADRQLYAEGGSEPAARAEESMPGPALAVEPEPAPPAEPRQVEPVPPPASKKRSRKKTTRGGAQTQRSIAVLNRIFPENTKYRDRYPDENEMQWLDVWDMFCKEYSRYAKERHSKYKCPSQSTVRRAMGRAE